MRCHGYHYRHLFYYARYLVISHTIPRVTKQVETKWEVFLPRQDVSTELSNYSIELVIIDGLLGQMCHLNSISTSSTASDCIADVCCQACISEKQALSAWKISRPRWRKTKMMTWGDDKKQYESGFLIQPKKSMCKYLLDDSFRCHVVTAWS